MRVKTLRDALCNSAKKWGGLHHRAVFGPLSATRGRPGPRLPPHNKSSGHLTPRTTSTDDPSRTGCAACARANPRATSETAPPRCGAPHAAAAPVVRAAVPQPDGSGGALPPRVAAALDRGGRPGAERRGCCGSVFRGGGARRRRGGHGLCPLGSGRARRGTRDGALSDGGVIAREIRAVATRAAPAGNAMSARRHGRLPPRAAPASDEPPRDPDGGVRAAPEAGATGRRARGAPVFVEEARASADEAPGRRRAMCLTNICVLIAAMAL